jgi:sigma-B regulation protein RsbU (phosphoserine phosphatase)
LLVAEDDETLRTAIRRFFQRNGFAVVEAADGDQALAAVSGQSFDVVLLDWMMPGRSGLEVLDAVRRIYAPTELPVIMATALGQGSEVVEALRRGANDYLLKPFDFAVALARVQTQLSLKRSVERITCLEKSLARSNAELAQANSRMKKDLEAAARVQQALLPDRPLEIEGACFAWHYRPCSELAGDLINVTRLDGRHVALAILDVVGHGVKAALLAVQINRVLGQLLAPTGRKDSATVRPLGPDCVAEALNRIFPWDDRTEQFCTLLVGVLDLEIGRFDFVSAGHPVPFWLPRSGPPRSIQASGAPIGLGKVPYRTATVSLSPGDRLYLYSDGLTDARGPTGEYLGHDRLLAALHKAQELPLQDGLTILASQVERWCAPATPHDDISILAVEWAGSPAVGHNLTQRQKESRPGSSP